MVWDCRSSGINEKLREEEVKMYVSYPDVLCRGHTGTCTIEVDKQMKSGPGAVTAVSKLFSCFFALMHAIPRCFFFSHHCLGVLTSMPTTEWKTQPLPAE